MQKRRKSYETNGPPELNALKVVQLELLTAAGD